MSGRKKIDDKARLHTRFTATRLEGASKRTLIAKPVGKKHMGTILVPRARGAPDKTSRNMVYCHAFAGGASERMELIGKLWLKKGAPPDGHHLGAARERELPKKNKHI